jgi:G3E family GTPase
VSRPELLVLCGLHAPGAEAVIARIRASDPDVAVLHHDLREIGSGRVHRRLRHRDRDDWTELQLAHGCLSCTLREDLLPQLHLLSEPDGPRRIVLHLDPALEPEQVCWSLLHVLVDGAPITERVDLRGVITCVDTGTWLDDATGDATLAERGAAELPDDERTVAQVAVGQAEFADLIVHIGTADAWQLARTDAVLERLAPGATRTSLAALDARVLLTDLPPGARRGRPDDVHDPLLRGQPPLSRDCGVQLSVFSARRPFHPARLHDAVDALLDGVVRTRGRIWLATRPESVLWLESAGGGLRIGQAGEWLAAGGPAAWAAAGPERRALASLGWHPRFGDRSQDVAVLSLDADPSRIEAALAAALLTDAELAAGERAWRALPDPFGWWHTDPCGDPPADLAAAGRPDTEHEEH